MLIYLVAESSGNSISAKKLYFLYESDVHYNVIRNIKAAMARRYVSNVCDTS